ncbi:Paraneoplastic antigen-like protein 5 [Lemmus lemmus]
MAVALLDDWCKGMDLDPKKAVLIVGIPVQCSEVEIKDTLKEGLPPLCAHKVIGRMFRREDKAKAVLIELNEVVNYTMMPTHIPAVGGAWEVVVKPRSPDNEFIKKLIYFLKDEGRRMVDVAKALGFSTAPTLSMELRNSDQDKPEGSRSLCNSVCYPKLKVFSGSPFPGPGEETFETWLEEVSERMQVWQVCEEEKKRRLLESLRGSALSTMQALWASNDSLTMEQCLKALKQIFGNKEDCNILQSQFLQNPISSQKPAEKLSEYLLRLEPLLQKAAQQSPLAAHSTDSIRLQHVLSRVSLTTGLRSRLSFLDQQGCPPTFLELLKLTQDEEWETSMVAKEEQNQAWNESRTCEAATDEVTTQAGLFREISTQTTGEEVTLVKRRRRLLWRPSAGEEGPLGESGFGAQNEPEEQKPHVAAQELGNERGAGAMSHPNPREI